jgi:hypothetical protein
MPEVPYCPECTPRVIAAAEAMEALDDAKEAVSLMTDRTLEAERACRRGEYQAAIAALSDPEIQQVADTLAAWCRGSARRPEGGTQ